MTPPPHFVIPEKAGIQYSAAPELQAVRNGKCRDDRIPAFAGITLNVAPAAFHSDMAPARAQFTLRSAGGGRKVSVKTSSTLGLALKLKVRPIWSMDLAKRGASMPP